MSLPQDAFSRYPALARCAGRQGVTAITALGSATRINVAA
jgi:hypothetical protein